MAVLLWGLEHWAVVPVVAASGKSPTFFVGYQFIECEHIEHDVGLRRCTDERLLACTEVGGQRNPTHVWVPGMEHGPSGLHRIFTPSFSPQEHGSHTNG